MAGMQRAGGITLVELLIALAVASVLLGLVVPLFDAFVEHNRSAAAINQFIGAVQLARQSAITVRSTVTLCPGTPTDGCGARDSWHLGSVLFIDRNKDGVVDADDSIIRGVPALPAGTRLTWRSFRSRSYLQFRPTGLTSWQNGTLLYCPASGDPRFARAAIINAQGRVRLAPDRDGDGIPEDATGRPLSCS
jgi:type IV fimbrial biogenesis protein FimT